MDPMNERSAADELAAAEAEQTERAELRKEYIEEMKSSLRAQLERTSIKELDGTIHKVSKKN